MLGIETNRKKGRALTLLNSVEEMDREFPDWESRVRRILVVNQIATREEASKLSSSSLYDEYKHRFLSTSIGAGGGSDCIMTADNGSSVIPVLEILPKSIFK